MPSPSPKIKARVETELQVINEKLKEREEVATNFTHEFFKAAQLEKDHKWTDAIIIYQDLWDNPKFQAMPERNNIKFPICIQISPKGAKIAVDGEIQVSKVESEYIVVPCHPEFKKIEISLNGYETRTYFNSFRNPTAIPRVDEQGRRWDPILEGKIEVTLAKANLWNINFSESGRVIVEATPCYAYADGMLFIASRDDRIYAFSHFTTGSKPEKAWVWSNNKYARLSSFSVTPSYYNDVLYIGGNNGRFYAINTKKPTLWGMYSLPKIAPIQASSAISSKYETVVFGAHDGQVYALPLLDAFTREWQERWKFSTGKKIDASLVIADEKVFVVSNDGKLYALDISTGKEIWRYELDRVGRCTPVIDGNTLYIASNGYLRSVEVSSGKETGRVEIQGDVLGSLSMYKNTIYCATNGKIIYAISPNLEIRWQYKGTAAFKASPVISKKGILYIGSQRGYKEREEQKLKIGFLHALNAQSGKLLWTYEIPQDLNASPVVIGDIVVQVADKLYGFLDD